MGEQFSAGFYKTLMQLPLQHLTIVGVGLIGGSIGLAAKKRGLALRIHGVGRDLARLEAARRLGAIDECHLHWQDAVQQSELIVFCTPVSRIAEQIHEAAAHCKSGALLTDAGSTKRDVVSAVETGLAAQVRFVGAHPLAGSEKKGPDFADADLFVDRWTILTPTEKTPVAAVEDARSFWHALGSRVRLMSPEDHDRALALTSHLPHLLAAALDQLETRLRQFREAMLQSDRSVLDQLLADGKKVRDALGS